MFNHLNLNSYEKGNHEMGGADTHQYPHRDSYGTGSDLVHVGSWKK